MKTSATGKFDRLLRILFILDGNAKCDAEMLAHDLETSKRSVYRYMASLIGAGFPISYDPEKKTYTFSDGYALGKARLNPEETLALHLAGKTLAPLGCTFERALESLKQKIADNVGKQPIHVKTPLPKPVADLSELITKLTSSCAEHRMARIEYRALYSEELSTRDIEPYFLFISPDGFWNLRAYCRKRDAWRVFALDRILKLNDLDRYFLPREIEHKPGQQNIEGFGTYFDGQPTEIVIRFAPVIRSFVERAQWHPSQQTKNLPDGWLEIHFYTLGIEAVKYWLYRWIPYVRIIEPDELRKDMLKDLQLQQDLLLFPEAIRTL